MTRDDQNTVFIQLTALGAYSIFGPLEKALIEFLPFSASVEWFILQQSNQCAVMTKHEDVTTQGFCKKLGRLWESLLFVLIQFQFQSHCHSSL